MACKKTGIMTAEELRKMHKKLHESSFEPKGIYRGYADRSLYINLSTNEVKVKPISEDMKKNSPAAGIRHEVSLGRG